MRDLSRVEVAIYVTPLQRAVLKVLASREGVTTGALLDDRFAKSQTKIGGNVDSVRAQA